MFNLFDVLSVYLLHYILFVTSSFTIMFAFPPRSSDLNEVNVSIAGSVCDVQSTNDTHIICVTSAQRQSQEAKVRVSIRDQGVARMVLSQSQIIQAELAIRETD